MVSRLPVIDDADAYVQVESQSDALTVDEATNKVFEQYGIPKLGGASGRGWSWYCVTPETRVLTVDLRWVPAGDLKAGQMLIGFDENSTTGMGAKRRLKPSRVITNIPIKRPVYKVILSDGTELRSSAEHPWLVFKSNGVSAKLLWTMTKDLKVGQAVPRFFKPWSESTSPTASYLSGIYDGEGSLCVQSVKAGANGYVHPNRGPYRVDFAQNEGLVLNKGVGALRALGFDASIVANKREECRTVFVRGGITETFRLLGTVRPVRLIDKFVKQFQEAPMLGQIPRAERLTIISVEYEGVVEVAGLQTSSKTYFAEGFGAHNSTMQRCWYLYKQKYVGEASRVRPSKALEVGGFLHTLLAVYYSGLIEQSYPLSPEALYEEVMNLGANPERIAEGYRLYEAYVTRYSVDWIVPLAVELFAEDPETGNTCRYDGIVEVVDPPVGITPGIYVLEHKTSARFDGQALDGWRNDGEVIGQMMIWEKANLEQRFGRCQGVIVNMIGKQKQPQFERIIVPLQSWQLEAHENDLRYWRAVEAMNRATNTWPRSRANCITKYGFCDFYDHCSNDDSFGDGK